MLPGKEALVLFLEASKKLPPDFIDLEPETICQMMKISRKDCAKIFAIATAIYHHAIFEDYDVFEKAVVTLNDDDADFSIRQEINACEIAWAVKAIRMTDDLYPFSTSILSAIAIYLHEEGFLQVPEVLASEKSNQGFTIQVLLNELNQNKNPLSNEGIKVQKMLQDNVSSYVADRTAKLNSELKHERLIIG